MAKSSKLSTPISDFRYEEGMSIGDLMEKLGHIGYQASSVKKAADIITEMKTKKAKIFLTFTSNMVSSGLRGLFAQMIQRGFADVVITTIGSIEEDIIKANNGKFYLGNYEEDDAKLGAEGINRIGNILIQSKVYASFESLVKPMLEKAIKPGEAVTPSELMRRLGGMCEDPGSILCQAYRKKVPIYCPAITDGSFGFQLQDLRNRRQFQIDVVADMKNIVFETGPKDRIGIIALGGGVAKHHAILANLINGGADYAVYVTTASQYSGSLSGATTEEARSWGKIKPEGKAVTVHGDVSVIMPLVMSAVFEKIKV